MRDHKALIGTVVHETEAAVEPRDHILYALALGYGSDPTSPNHLAHVYEENLVPLPGMAMIVAYPGFWMRDAQYGFKWQQILHAEEMIEVHAPLPVSGRVRGRTVIEDVVDRGAEKGCFVYIRKELRDTSDKLLATVVTNTLARADGGFGGGGTPRPAMPAPPPRPADAVVDLPTLPQAALLYRLSGDMNPLHADPAIARAAGFDRPILHGRCTLSIAIRGLIDKTCGRDARRLRAVGARFSAPVLPGETLRTEIWREDVELTFRTTVVERDVVVLNNGYARLGPSPGVVDR